MLFRPLPTTFDPIWLTTPPARGNVVAMTTTITSDHTTTRTANTIAVGDTVILPHWIDKRPAGHRSNIVFAAVTVTSILEYPDNRVLYGDSELVGATHGVVGRTAVLEVRA